MAMHLVSIFKTSEMCIHKNNLCVDKTSPLIFLILYSNFRQTIFLTLSPVPFTVSSVMTNFSCAQANSFCKSKLDVLIQTNLWVDKKLLFHSTYTQ
jgi:hypothetical protein